MNLKNKMNRMNFRREIIQKPPVCTALILAAGEGRRMSTLYEPKPLVPLLGLTLIERLVLTLRDCNINNIFVVVGYSGDKIRKHVESFKQSGIEVQFIENPHWKRGNLSSLGSAKGYIPDEPFLLVMADHYIASGIMKKVIHGDVPEDGMALAIDRDLAGPHVNPNDVTGVLLEENRVRRIGKGIPDINAADVGIALCTSGVVERACTLSEQGATEVSELVQVLADQDKVLAIDITRELWCDVDTPAMLQQASRLILRGLSKPTDGPISRWINRRLSLAITRHAVSWRKIGPNTFSVLSFLVSVLGAILFLDGRRLHDIAGALLVQVSSVLDGCDGEIARLTHRTTHFGAWLDRVLDRYGDGFLILTVTYRVFGSHPDTWVWWLGGFTLLATLTASYLAIPVESEANPTLALTNIRLGRDVRLFLISIGALFQQFFILMWALFAIGHFELARRFHRLWKLRSHPDH